MGKRVHRIYVDMNHKHGENEYVQGVIRGIVYVVCKSEKNDSYAWEENKNMHTITLPVECTEHQFRKAAEMIEKLYPKLCVFAICVGDKEDEED